MAAMGERVPVYLDCDTGIDDVLAIAFLLSRPELELVGIGMSFQSSSRLMGRADAELMARRAFARLVNDVKENRAIAPAGTD